MIDYVKRQLVYWAQIQAAGALFDIQCGPGALTVANAASVYTVTMPANFTIPIARRSIILTTRGSAALVTEATYEEANAGNLVNTVVYRTWAAAAGAVTAAANVGVILELGRVEFLIGGGVG
jgi:hypothetical protein